METACDDRIARRLRPPPPHEIRRAAHAGDALPVQPLEVDVAFEVDFPSAGADGDEVGQVGTMFAPCVMFMDRNAVRGASFSQS